MIGPQDIRLHAENPGIPLPPLVAYVGSPSQLRLLGVPAQIGNWRITAVHLTANYPDNSSPSVPCAATCGVWHGTLPASTAPGVSAQGFRVTADGIDENGDAVTGYVLGVGKVTILDTDGTITVGETTYYVHLVATTPTAPKKGDLDLSTMRLWDGASWISLGCVDLSAYYTKSETDAALAGKLDINPIPGTTTIVAGTNMSLQQGYFVDGVSGGIILSNGKPVVAVAADSSPMDTTPTTNSQKPVTSGGVKSALDAKASSASLAPAFSSTATYAVGDLVTREGRLYACTTAVTTAGAWNLANWADTTVLAQLLAKLSGYLPLSGGTISGDVYSTGFDVNSQDPNYDGTVISIAPGAPATGQLWISDLPRGKYVSIEADNVSTDIGTPSATATWPAIIAAANGNSSAYAKPADIRYALAAATLAGDATNGYTASLADRAITTLANFDGAVTLSFPAQVSGKARDFILRVEQGATVQSVNFPAAVTYEGDDFPTWEASTTYLLSFTETKANTFLMKVMEAEAVTQSTPAT